MRHRLTALIPLVVGVEIPPGLIDLDTRWRVPECGDETAVILGSLRQRAYAAPIHWSWPRLSEKNPNAAFDLPCSRGAKLPFSDNDWPA